MKKIFFLTSMTILLFGCAESHINDSLIQPSSHINIIRDTVTIIPINATDKRFSKCLKSKLENEIPDLKIVPEDKFRDALFPWFESNTFPNDIDELSNLMNNDFVRERIESLGVRFVILIHGLTAQSKLEGGGGGVGVAAVGILAAERETRIHATVWDLNEVVSLGDVNAESQGDVGTIIIGLPIPMLAFTESTACSEVAKQISNCITGRGLYLEKPDNQ